MFGHKKNIYLLKELKKLSKSNIKIIVRTSVIKKFLSEDYYLNIDIFLQDAC